MYILSFDKKHQTWVFMLLSAGISILEGFIAFSCNSWNIIWSSFKKISEFSISSKKKKKNGIGHYVGKQKLIIFFPELCKTIILTKINFNFFFEFWTKGHLWIWKLPWNYFIRNSKWHTRPHFGSIRSSSKVTFSD